jgi:hypothetical protein
MRVGPVIKHAPSPTNNITTAVISEFLKKNFTLPFFHVFDVKILAKFNQKLAKLLVEIYTRKTQNVFF